MATKGAVADAKGQEPPYGELRVKVEKSPEGGAEDGFLRMSAHAQQMKCRSIQKVSHRMWRWRSEQRKSTGSK